MHYAKEIFSFTKEAISYKKDELSYLSLTGKPEGPIRDRVAWLFQQKYKEKYPNIIATREYKRYDLVIMEPNKNSNKEEPDVKHIFEFKVGSAVSFRKELKKAKEYIDRVITDFKKAHKNGDLEKLTSVFIGVEPYEFVDKNKKPFIKYAKRSNTLWNNGEKNEPNETYVNKKMVAYFKKQNGFECIFHDYVNLEDFEDIGVRLHLLILKPGVDYVRGLENG